MRRFPIAIVLAAAPFFLNACLTDAKVGGCGCAGKPRLFVTTSDFQSGALRSFDLETLEPAGDSLQVNQDSRVLALDGFIYVLERFGADNLLKYDPGAGKVVYQKHLGDGWNPFDLVSAGGGAGFLSVEDRPFLLKVNLESGTVLDSLDISDYSYRPGAGDSGSAAASPHARALARKGDTLFVVLQRRNGSWQHPGGYSVVLLVRVSTFQVLDTLQAPGRNASDLWLDGNDLFLSCPGTIGVQDGALVRWNLTTGAVSSVVTEEGAGADFGGMACWADGQCFAQIYRAFGDEPVRRFDARNGTWGDMLSGVVDAFGGLAVDAATGKVYVGERNPTASGLLAYGADGAKLKGPVATGLPPSSLAVFR